LTAVYNIRHSSSDVLDSGNLLQGPERKLRVTYYSEFRKQCIQRHDLPERDTTAHMRLDLENWLLTLIKSEGE
jgi:hypothetical protein